MKKFLVILLVFTLFIQSAAIVGVSANTNAAGYEQDFTQFIYQWNLSEGDALTFRDNAIFTRGRDVPTGFLKGDSTKWTNFEFNGTFARMADSGDTWISIFLGGLRILIRGGSIGVLVGNEAERGVGSYPMETGKDYNLRVRVSDGTAELAIKAANEIRFTELGTVTNVPVWETSRFGVSSLNIVARFSQFQIISRDQSTLVTDQKIYTVPVGGKQSIKVTNNTGASAAFAAEDPSVLTVSSSGEVTILKDGETTVTVTAGGVSQEVHVIAYSPPTEVRVSHSAFNLQVGEAADLSVTVLPGNVSDRAVMFESSNPEIARIVGNGATRKAVLAVSPGTTTVRVRARSGEAVGTAQVTVTAKAPSGSSTAALKADGAVQKIHKGVYGFHNESMSKLSRPDVFPTFTTDNEMTAFRELKVQSLRGPDGGPANLFLALEGTGIPPDDSRWEMYGNTNPQNYTHFVSRGRGMFLKDLYFPSEELGIPYILCVNVYSQTVDEVVEIVSEIKKVSNRPVRLEMGNEVYDNQGRSIFATAHDYMAKVGEIYTKVNALYDDVSIGVVLLERGMEKRITSDPNNNPPNGNADDKEWGETFIGRLYNWNRIVSEYPDYFDAVIAHPYTEIPNFNGVTAEQLWRFMLSANKEQLDGILYQYWQFPGKEIWLTEWGTLPGTMFGEPDTAERGRLQVLKDPGTALTQFERLLYFIQMGEVHFGSYHVPFDNQGFGVFQDDRTTKNPNFYTFAKAGELVEKYDYFYNIVMSEGNAIQEKLRHTGEDVTWAIEDVGAWAFGTANEIKEIVIFNRTGSTMKVGLENGQLQPTWQYGNNADPFPSYLIDTERWWTQPAKSNPSPVTLSGGFSQEVTIPPYSMIAANVQADMAAVNSSRVLPTTSNAEQFSGGTNGRNLTDSGRAGGANALNRIIAVEIDNSTAFAQNQIKAIDPDNANVAPTLRNGRTYVPLRFIAEAFGAEVSFVQETQEIIIIYKDKRIVFTNEVAAITIDGNSIELDAASFIEEGRTFVPLRAISEAMNMNVYWIPDSWVVISESGIDVEAHKTGLEEIFSLLK